VDDLRAQTDKLAKAIDHHAPSAQKHATHMRDAVVPVMQALREAGDQIELLIPHELWPLPTYREMLFVK
jgi:glutamine synthetase